MRAPRMSTRRWMVAVALLSLALGGYREVRRLKRIRDGFLWRSEREELIAKHYRRRGSPAHAEFYAGRARRYAARASRPWLHDTRVAPNPK